MTRAAAVLLVLALCACFCLTQLAEVDLYWHLLAGERILAEHHVPRFDSFTYTSAGRPWVDLHWLFQVLLALAHRTGGWTGLDLLKTGLIVGGFAGAILAALTRVRSTTVAALALLGVVAAQERFTLRPEAASFFMLGLLLLCLHQRHRHPRLLFIVPPLIALWANLHALYAVGLALIGVVLAGDLVEHLRSPQGTTPPARRPLVLAAAAAIPASLLTPYGLAGWALPGRLLFERVAADNVYGRTIAEFQAPFGGFGRTTSVAAFAILALCLSASLVVARRSVQPADLFVLVAFCGLALLARRNIPLFVLVALPSGAPAVDAALRVAHGWLAGARSAGVVVRRAFPERLLAFGVAFTALVLVVDVVSNRFFVRDGTQRYFGSGPAPGYYPEAAAGFALQHRIRGEILNDMTMGGYLAWRWFPGRRVFIDGRLEVHDTAVYASYLRLQQDPDTFETVARRYGIEAVLWSHRHSADAAPLLRYLAAGTGWRPVFIDLAAVLFVREPGAGVAGGSPPAIDLGGAGQIDRLLAQAGTARRRSRRHDPLPAPLRRLLPRRDVPVAVVSAALFYAIIDRLEASERLFRAALDEAPQDPVLHYDLGVVLERAGRSGEARRAFEAAIRLDGSLAAAHAALGLLLWRAGDGDGALREWHAAERRERLPAASLQARGTLRARRGQIDEAIEDYRRAIEQAPGRAALHAELALLYHHRGLRDQAAVEIRRALNAAPQACAPRLAAARMRAADGDEEGAEGLYREALAVEPRCFEARLALAELLVSLGRSREALHEVLDAVRDGAGPSSLSAAPGLRTLVEHPEVRELLRRRAVSEEEPR